ncbi:MAG: PaaI family thioesterase [Solirubrobacterales bacterium]
MEETRFPPSPFDLLLGTEWVSTEPEDTRARIGMRDELRQPMGILHGGVMASLVESVCSMSTAKAVFADNRVAMGQNISVNFLRPISAGGMEVRAEAIHRGRMTWVWRAQVLDSDGRTCAVAQMTIAVRDAPEGVALEALAPGDLRDQDGSGR